MSHGHVADGSGGDEKGGVDLAFVELGGDGGTEIGADAELGGGADGGEGLGGEFADAAGVDGLEQAIHGKNRVVVAAGAADVVAGMADSELFGRGVYRDHGEGGRAAKKIVDPGGGFGLGDARLAEGIVAFDEDAAGVEDRSI